MTQTNNTTVYLSNILFPSEFGDWTQLKPSALHSRSENVSGINSDGLSQRLLRKVHVQHCFAIESFLDVLSKKLNFSVRLFRSDFMYHSVIDLKSRFTGASYSTSINYLDYGSLNIVLTPEFSQRIAYRFLGGVGETNDRSSLSDIQKDIVHVFCELVQSVVAPAWNHVLTTDDLVLGSSLTMISGDAEFQSQMRYTVVFNVQLGESEPVAFCLSYRPRLFKYLVNELTVRQHVIKPNLRLPSTVLEKLFVPVTGELSRTELLMKDVSSIQVGDVIQLRSKITDPVLLHFGDVCSRDGQPGVVGRKLGIKLINNDAPVSISLQDNADLAIDMEPSDGLESSVPLVPLTASIDSETQGDHTVKPLSNEFEMDDQAGIDINQSNEGSQVEQSLPPSVSEPSDNLTETISETQSEAEFSWDDLSDSASSFDGFSTESVSADLNVSEADSESTDFASSSFLSADTADLASTMDDSSDLSGSSSI